MLGNFPDKTPQYLAQAAKVLDAVRAANKTGNKPPTTIVHVNVAFRPGRPELNPGSSIASRVKDMPANVFVEGDQSVALFDELTIPAAAKSEDEEPANEVFVTKRRVSALSGTDLPTILRGRGINHLVLCGVVTSGAVLSTLREAADMDYGLTVLGDLCMDSDEEVHRVLVEKVFTKQAEVLTAEEWVAKEFA
ncbi:isochorismatase hydrolase [Microdochium trichocladiopsis]|uniref:Isochorismatase hydrolase n=1 Tax=Microdochium trichocladiopsis TaxID=1682393 RepID=A0A9P9BLL7_9PEZI|nr:isochorismatase hydrolase [Microdochium trichocladiopsis]KAH7014222.1 isochorismatase hydrolase [Microdochium trichocladiopsis]